MGLLDFLKPRKAPVHDTSGSYITTALGPAELVQRIQQAVVMFELYSGYGKDMVLEKIDSNCQDEELALALFLFIPIAFCRLFLPEPQYSDEYVVYNSETDQKTRYFSKDMIYQKVVGGSRIGLAASASQENILKILSYGAEFDAINAALNGGAQLKDLVFGPVYFTS